MLRKWRRFYKFDQFYPRLCFVLYAEYLKSLLNCKKETAIQNLASILPLLKTRDVDAKTLIFKILPVLFSYVSLYDTEILNVFKICDILRYHPAFSADQG